MGIVPYGELQGVRYKAGRADRGVRPYGSQEVRWGGPMWASAPTERLQGERCKAGQADDSVRPVHSFFRLGATHIKKALCYDAGIIAKGFFILDCAYLTSSMMAVSAASPRRTPVRTMRV